MNPSSNKINTLGFLITISGAIFFSTKAIFVKLAFQDTKVDAVTLLCLRMLFSLPFYIGAAWIAHRKEGVVQLTRKQWLWVLTMGIFGYYLSSLFDFIGLQYVSAGLERLILFLYPTFAVLINTFYFKTKLSRIQVLALVLTYIGIGTAYWGEIRSAQYGPQFFYGSFMIFVCAVTYSFYLVGTGRLVNAVGATRYTAYAMLAASAGIFTHFLLTHPVQNVVMTSSLAGYGIALAIIATVLPSFMMSVGMKKIGSNNVAIITSIGPVSTILQAHFFLGETIIPEQILGTALVIVGVILIGWQSKIATEPS
ncbi:MAG: DMT family transporter [Sediminibacterium sp.]|uniref:DMT family transporter n=1 Tax=Sediminibacterium sp. TaxID=1917865 RepID=UPI002ABD0AED|nr:DMT family transporter [Sediminibacterium sp.]MDZ4072318.1 DMT family transporter [Sediminibacterium sp.]